MTALLHIASAMNVSLDNLLSGSQSTDKPAYFSEIQVLLEECSDQERAFLCDVVWEVKRSLHKYFHAA